MMRSRFALVRQHRWPDGVRCLHGESAAVARHGRDDGQLHRQRYRCTRCGARFDDLTGTVLANWPASTRFNALS